MAEERRRKTGTSGTGSSGTGTGGGVLGSLAGQAKQLAAAAGDRALSAASDWAGDATQRLTEYAERGGGPGLAAAVAGAKQVASREVSDQLALHAGMAGVKERISRALGGKGGRDAKKKLKVTNIVETIDVGVPVRVAYNQWTQFEDFPSFTKKVEHVERTSDEKLNWKAQIFWSHRTWESTIVEQVPDRRVVWRSQGEKGSVDGSVTFHELAPELTRILLVLEYHPQGLFERTGNIWRAQGRRARLELKHFARHVATQTALHPDEVKGWRGEIRDGKVIRGHEDGADSSDKTADRAAGEGAQARRPRGAGRRDRGEGDRGEGDRGDRDSDRRPARSDSAQSREKPAPERTGAAGRGAGRKSPAQSAATPAAKTSTRTPSRTRTTTERDDNGRRDQ